MSSALERDAAILRGALRSLGIEARLEDRLGSIVAHALLAEDPRWTPLALPPPSQGPAAFELAQLEAQGFLGIGRLDGPTRVDLVARALAVAGESDPARQQALARELAAQLLATAGRRALLVARESARGGRNGCLVLGILGFFGVLFCGGVLVAMLEDSGPGRTRRPRARVQTPPRARETSAETSPDPDADPEPDAPRPVAPTPDERAAAAVGVLRAIGAAEVLARDVDTAADRSFRYLSLVELATRGRLRAELASGHEAGYAFDAAASTNAPGERFWATAVPEATDEGARFLFTNHTGVVLAAVKPFVVDPETCEPREPAPEPAPPARAGEPDRARPFARAGTDALYAGRWLAAIEPLETALELAPSDVESWNNLGKAYLELGATDRKRGDGPLAENLLLARAEEALAHGVSVANVRSPALRLCEHNLGRVFLARGDDAGRLPTARADRDRAAVALATEAALHLERALALEPADESSRIDAAAAWLRAAEHVDPDRRRELGAKAVAALERCPSLAAPGPNTRAARTNLGLAYRAAGRPRECVRALATVLEAGTGSVDAGTAAALRSEAVALVRSAGAPLPEADRALLRHAAELLRARGRSGAPGGVADEEAAEEIGAALGGK